MTDGRLSAERLAAMRRYVTEGTPCDRSTSLPSVLDLLAHIDALQAENERQREAFDRLSEQFRAAVARHLLRVADMTVANDQAEEQRERLQGQVAALREALERVCNAYGPVDYDALLANTEAVAREWAKRERLGGARDAHERWIDLYDASTYGPMETFERVLADMEREALGFVPGGFSLESEWQREAGQ